MNKFMKLISLFAGLGIALLTAGCEKSPPSPEVVQVEKTAYDKLLKERDNFKMRAETAEKQKTVEVVQGMTPEACTAMAKDIVADSCTAKTKATTSASRTTHRRNLASARSQSTATATARGNATATATATAGGAAPQSQGSGPVLPAPGCGMNCDYTPNQQLGTIWLWHDPYATATDPKPCVIASDDGRGLPPYCSGFSVKPALANETKNQWLVRVGGGHRPTDTGLYQKQ